MLSLHFYLDKRRVSSGEPAPVKLIVSKHQRNGMLSTGVSVPAECWDASGQKVVRSPRAKALNGHLARLKTQAEDFLLPLLYGGKLAGLSAPAIASLLREHIYGKVEVEKTLGELVEGWIEGRRMKATAGAHRIEWRRILRYDPKAASIPLTKVTPGWAAGLDSWMVKEGYGQNTRLTTFSVLRGSWHSAGITPDPFEKVHIRQALTAKRDLTLEQLRRLWNAIPQDAAEAEALDFFKCSFLMRAANAADILKMRPDQMKNGRLYYTRCKTGKQYSVKVEPELEELLARHSNGSRLWPYRGNENAHRSYINPAYKRIAQREGLPSGLTVYWGRHTLASLLYNRGVSMDVVSATLGHSLGGARVTSTYIDADLVAVDREFRALLDEVTRP